MDKEEIAELLKAEILKIENSNKSKEPNDKILIAHVPADLFLKMAYLFVGMHGK